jgi:hypothetical protein
MEPVQTRHWFLRKSEDGAIFGPLTFAQLERWAANAQVAPHDSVSTDQASWLKAPMLPELAMDWLVEVTTERYYGPTTLGAVREFVRLGDIDATSFIINACDGSRRQIQELPGILEDVTASAEMEEEPIMQYASSGHEPQVSGIEIEMQERIRDLEQTLAEERRAFNELEQHYRDLARKHNELLNLQAHSGRSS